MTILAKLVSRPADLAWWEWAKLGGALGILILGLLMTFRGWIPSPVTLALLLHLFCDFTAQSGETAANKSRSRRHLWAHALAAGGFPLVIAGLSTGSPWPVLVWPALATLAHVVVDGTQKFGLGPCALGVVLDQMAHATATVAIIGLTWGLYRVI
jgi:hypothetical protein